MWQFITKLMKYELMLADSAPTCDRRSKNFPSYLRERLANSGKGSTVKSDQNQH